MRPLSPEAVTNWNPFCSQNEMSTPPEMPQILRVFLQAAATRRMASAFSILRFAELIGWPAYSYVAPVSWLLARNVTEGRREINLSQALRGQPARVAGEMAETITKGEMPPRDYIILHPAAALNAADRQTLIEGLRITLGGGR